MVHLFLLKPNQQHQNIEEETLIMLRGGSVVGRWTCEVVITGRWFNPGRSAFTLLIRQLY